MESFNKNNSVLLKKTLSSSGFIRAIRTPANFCSFIWFQSSYWPSSYILEAECLERYICSGTTGSTFQDMAGPWRQLRLSSTWSAVSPPNPPLVVVTQTVLHWFMSNRPLNPPTVLNDITAWRSRLNSSSFQTPQWNKIDLIHMWNSERVTTAMLWQPYYHLVKPGFERKTCCWVKKKVKLRVRSYSHLSINGTNWLTVSFTAATPGANTVRQPIFLKITFQSHAKMV